MKLQALKPSKKHLYKKYLAKEKLRMKKENHKNKMKLHKKQQTPWTCTKKNKFFQDIIVPILMNNRNIDTHNK